MKYLKAKDIMNTEVFSVRDDMTVQEVAGFLTEREILGAPVVDSEGEIVGVVSCTDIAQSTTTEANILLEGSTPGFYEHGWEDKLAPNEMVRLHVEENESLPVREIMTPTIYTVPEDTPISDIAKAMVAGRIHRLLVTRGTRLVGIITTLDMLKIFFD
ncbi:MAG: CBS domain-containing protein [Desulfuromonadales bacterium]|nr:CBS domain-containing protein [Desulfuromonadales bacterium]